MFCAPRDDFTYERCPYSDERCGTCQYVGYHDQAIVVAVDGACRGNGTLDATAASGVFFAPDSYHNFGGMLSDRRPTNQQAELEAAIAAFRCVQRMRHENFDWDIERVIIKADSEYVVKGMTSWICKWKSNGYTNSRGLPVTNEHLFAALDDLILELNEDGLGVQFWHVPRAFSQDADKLANLTLENQHFMYPRMDGASVGNLEPLGLLWEDY